MQPSRPQEVFYRITDQSDVVEFQQIFAKIMYDNDEGGFIRKAIIFQKPFKLRLSSQGVYQDADFQLPQSNSYKLIRLYDIYQKQIPLFPEEQLASSFIEVQNSYNTFVAQSGLISFEYLRTLFITQKINKQGYYQYFVKRNGQYYLQDCDDLIPVNKFTKKPLWSLSTNHPWQLLLLKAWIKQCGSLYQLQIAQPFKFLQVFGLPLYRDYNFRKQLKFLRNQKVPAQNKKSNYSRFVMNRNDLIIIAQTINDNRVKKIGLQPNFAAYRILRMTKPQQQPIFRIFSSLPCSWIGTLNVVNNTKLNQIYHQNMFLDLQRNFLMNEKQLTTYFNKFYVVPYQFNNSQAYKTQDCVVLGVDREQSAWLCFEVHQRQGLLGIGLQLVDNQDKQNFSIFQRKQFRFFLTKKRNDQQIEKSHIRSDITSQPKISEYNLSTYSESNCDKWEYIYIDYVQGYQNKSNFFCNVTEGFYALHIISDHETQINVRLDSFVSISKPVKYYPSQKLIKQIFDSTFYSISQDVGVQASFNRQTFDQSICLNNSFEQFGYGSIVIKTLSKSKHRVAMKVYPQKFQQAGYLVLCSTNEPITLVSAEGKPEIIVLQKLSNRSQNTLGQVFPPPGTVQFFRVIPNPK